MELTSTWFTVVFVLFAGFAVLDAFDLGVGSLQFLWRTDAERQRAIDTVLPVWDGHELWLLAAGAVLFVAFPPVFTLVMSAFAALLAVVVLAFLGRAVAIESCAKPTRADEQCKANLNVVTASILPPLLLGIALGNVLRGLPIDSAGRYGGDFVNLLNPYALLIGILTVLLFAMHGALHLESRTEGAMRDQVKKWIFPLWCAFAVVHLVATAATVWWAPTLFDGINHRPLFWVFTALWVAGFFSVPLFVVLKRFAWATVASTATIVAMVGLVGVALFPSFIPSTSGGAGLTIDNSSASPGTLRTSLVAALIAISVIVAVTASIHRASRRGLLATNA